MEDLGKWKTKLTRGEKFIRKYNVPVTHETTCTLLHNCHKPRMPVRPITIEAPHLKEGAVGFHRLAMVMLLLPKQ